MRGFRRHLPSLAPLCVALGTLSFFACADDGGDDGDVGMDDAPELAARVICEAYFECDCTEHDDTFSSQENCELEVAADVQASIDEGVEAELTYDGECVGDITGAIEGLGCDTFIGLFLDPEAWAEFSQDAECKMFYGDKEAGESCTEYEGGDDCLKDLVCDNDVCGPNDFDSLLQEGDSCGGQGDECQPGLYCVDIDGLGEQTCEELPAIGDTCRGVSDLCTLQAYCDQDTKTCVALPSDGDDCSPSPNIWGQRCELYSECNADEACEAAPGAGENCTFSCAEGLSCENGTCVVAPAVVCSIAVCVGTDAPGCD